MVQFEWEEPRTSGDLSTTMDELWAMTASLLPPPSVGDHAVYCPTPGQSSSKREYY